VQLEHFSQSMYHMNWDKHSNGLETATCCKEVLCYSKSTWLILFVFLHLQFLIACRGVKEHAVTLNKSIHLNSL